MATESSFSKGYLEEIGIMGEASVPSMPAQAPLPSALKKDSKAAAAKPEVSKAKEETQPPAASSPAEEPAELTPEQLKKLSKEERKAYHEAKRAAEAKGQPAAKAKQMTKAERRQIQEAQRKLKEDSKQVGKDNEELLAELKLQGLSEDQAREVMNEMLKGEDLEEDNDDEPDEEDLMSSVRRWMSEQDAKVTKGLLSDFNLKVRFQGHVDSTPPDHLNCVLRLVFEEACQGCDLTSAKLQPTAVQKKVAPLLERWLPILEPLYGKIDDVIVATDAVCKAVQEGVKGEAGHDPAMVGCLMALRDVDLVEDEDLLTGCRRIEPRGQVLDKYINFLEDAIASDDDEDDD
eukprot:TRINITY_DN76073_c0_g1_i1.p1 TRINITY_DN76073_c0_g1~~TRINITY_DN76073_c0_g1_i1.p1  ORF type:complete len:347 (-),score=116.76 TRINITY_DN76073_c0_g1_i1:150-1190(-)